MLEHVKRMDHLDQAGFNVNAAMTALLPMAHTVYTGDDDGRVVSSPSSPRRKATTDENLVRVGLYPTAMNIVCRIPNEFKSLPCHHQAISE